MIFKRLFQPKYQHKDPAVRIQALQQLNPGEPQQKTILHELAFNDSNAAVSLAALDKLNNFDLWWKMAGTSKDQRIAKKSRSKVEQFLLGKQGIQLSDSARRTFILECQDNLLLDLLLREKSIDEQDTDLMLSVLGKLNKPQFSLKILLQTQNKDLQKALFEQLDDESEIGKVVKKAQQPELLKLANDKLAQIQVKREKPIQLAKDVRLILSKLLALVDVSDYQKLNDGKEKLVAEFNSHETQLDILDPDTKSEFLNKYKEIVEKLERKVHLLHGEWHEEQEVKRQSELLNQAHETANNVLYKVNDALNSDASAITLGELESFIQGLDRAKETLSDIAQRALSIQERKGIEKLINKMLACRINLDNLPALQTALQQAQDLINKFTQLPLPNDFSQLEAAQLHVNEIADNWKELRAPYVDIWPTHIDSQWKETRKEWTKAISKLRNELEDNVKKCRSKFNVIIGQIKQGRYKNAMRHYEKLQTMFEALPEAQKNKLSKQYEGIKSEIENLKDWQDYIATPRKPELLKEIEQLALYPIEPLEQAGRVKELRAEWISLGKVGSETDELLNKAFDLACEEAFKPCREFYAEQDAKREQNLSEKYGLLDEVASMLQENRPVEELEKALASLRKKWKEVGEIDFKVKENLDQRYQEVVEPVKQIVNQFYQDNASIKQGIIDQTKSLLALDNWRDATDKAKQLQAEWKNVFRADAKIERKLWEEFRSLNDQIFAKRDQAVKEKNTVIEQQLQSIDVQLKELDEAISNASTITELDELQSGFLNGVEQAIAAVEGNGARKQKGFANKLKIAIREKRLYLADHQNAAQYKNVLKTLEQWTVQELPEMVAELPNYWRQAFQVSRVEDIDGLSGFGRHELLIVMELLDNKPVVAGEESLRKGIQLKMMASKLQHGEYTDLDELLKLWISKGYLSEEDAILLPRLKSIYIRK